MSKKLEILKQFLAKLEDETSTYWWRSPEYCNCGNLLQTIGIKKDEIYDLISLCNISYEVRQIYYDLQGEDINLPGAYRFLFSLYKYNDIQCELTNLPFTQVLNQLISHGFTLEELINLEHLKDKRFNSGNFNYENKEHLIEYVKNWIKYEEIIFVNKVYEKNNKLPYTPQNNKVLLQQKVRI